MYKLIVGGLFPAFLVTVGFIAWRTRDLWTPILGSEVDAQAWIGQFGARGPLVYLLIQVVQVVVFVIPGDVVQIAGGYLFGIAGGLLLSLAGIGIGSCVNFAIARSLGRPFVEGLFGERQVGRFDSLLESPGARTGFFLFFAIPGVPKDVLVYVAGISGLHFPVFLLVSMAGRIPGILGSAIIGNSAANQNWVLSGTVFSLAVLLFAIGVLFRSRIQVIVERLLRREARQHSAEAHPNGDRDT